jgi:hypothetical protein
MPQQEFGGPEAVADHEPAPPDALREHAGAEVAQREDREGDDQHERGLRARQTQPVLEDGRHQRDDGIQAQPEAGHEHEHLGEAPDRVAREELLDRCVGVLVGARLEHLALLDLAAEVDDERGRQHAAEEERDPPAPGAVRRVRVAAGRDLEHDQRQRRDRDVGEREPEHHLGAVEPALVLGRVLHRQRGRRRVLTADEDADEEAQRDEQHHRGHAPLRITGQAADQDRQRAEAADRDDRRAFAPEPVGVVAEDQRTDGTTDEGGGEDRAGDQRGLRIRQLG